MLMVACYNGHGRASTRVRGGGSPTRVAGACSLSVMQLRTRSRVAARYCSKSWRRAARTQASSVKQRARTLLARKPPMTAHAYPLEQWHTSY